MRLAKTSQPAATKKPASDYQQYAAEILARLDIAAEAEQLGVRFASSEPRENGWLECHAIDRDDTHPSAAIHVGDGHLRGRYKDLGKSERSISFFELAARLGPWSDWREAREHYATIAGVEPPANSKKPTEPDTDQYQPIPWRPDSVKTWCMHHKPGVEYDALMKVGAQLVKWPYRDGRGVGYHCLAIPSHDDRSDTDHPAGMVLLRLDGQPFPATAKLQARKIHTLRSSRPSYIAAGGVEAIQAATVVWWVEGVPDCLALTSRLPAGEIAITSIGGAAERPERLPLQLLAGKLVRVIGDCDTAGQDGAAERARALQGIASGVVVVRLPYPVEASHGRDLRDWLCEGHGYDELLTLPTAEPEPVEPKITNYKLVWDPASEKQKINALSISEITNNWLTVCGGWPKAQSGVLFFIDREQPKYLKRQSELFAFAHRKAKVEWTQRSNAGTPVTKEEILCNLSYSCEQYDAISPLPHYPPMPNTYYYHPALPEADGKTLAEFLALLNPETEQDRMLMLAALLTPGWGGEPGTRPGFLFRSAYGTGAGKSTTAKTFGRIWGGSIGCKFTSRSLDGLESRLLDDNSQAKRVVIIDNIRGNISTQQIEGMLTADEINAHRMYVGDASRRNDLTYYLTANTPSLSRDMSERCVTINVGKPISESFEAASLPFMTTRRMQLIADLLAILKADPKEEIKKEHRDRWYGWQAGVLSRIDGANELAKIIKDRRATIDADSEDAQDVHDYIASTLREYTLYGDRLDPDAERIAIPVHVMYDWLRELWGEPGKSDKYIRSRLNTLLHLDPLRNIQPNPCKTYGRTFLWEGQDCGPSQDVIYPWRDSQLQRVTRNRAHLGRV